MSLLPWGSPLSTSVWQTGNLLNRITPSAKLLAGAVLTLLTNFAALAAEKPNPPNIVLILADDMGYGDPGCYNPDSKTSTPNIDRLAKQGMRFTDAHSPASVCTPTRYGLLTGQYPWRTSLKKGVLQGYSPFLPEPSRMTLASLLRSQGYRTACIGKWHLGLGNQNPVDYAKPLTPGPGTVGFDYFFGIPASLDMPPYLFVENDRATAQPTGTIETQDKARGAAPFWRGGAIAPDFKHEDVNDQLTQKAVEFIEKAKGIPFFLYLPLASPHMPVLPTKNFQGKSQAGPYGDFVMQVDETVGRVLKAIDDIQASDNTLVVFTSDNGGYWFPEDIARWGHRSNGVLRGQKSDIWEAGHRVPFIARWPGKVPAGKTSSDTICLTDLLATTASLVKVKLPENAGEDSFDLTPVLFGKKLDRPIREATIHQSGQGMLAIRQGPWRLTPALGSHGFSQPKTLQPTAGGPQGELFNLEKDLSETENRWLAEPEVVQRLTALLEKLQKDGRSRPR